MLIETPKKLNYIPRVLLGRKRYGSISTERALNQIYALLEELFCRQSTEETILQSRVATSLDDVEFMLSCLSSDE